MCRFAALIPILALGGRASLAQAPARLPAVVVKATPDKPGPRKVGGIVVDTSATPIDSVEVAIVSLQRRVHRPARSFTSGFADARSPR